MAPTTSRLWKIQGDIACLAVCARLETRCGIWHTQVQHNGWMDGTRNEMDCWDSFCLPPCFPRTTLGKNPTFSNTLEDRVATMFVCCLIVLISVLVDMLFPFCWGGNWGSGTLGNSSCPRTQKYKWGQNLCSGKVVIKSEIPTVLCVSKGSILWWVFLLFLDWKGHPRARMPWSIHDRSKARDMKGLIDFRRPQRHWMGRFLEAPLFQSLCVQSVSPAIGTAIV